MTTTTDKTAAASLRANSESRGTASLAALACGLFVLVVAVRWPMLFRPFSSEGEAREAHVVADVVREGHWVAPYPNGDWIPTKGPFLYWWAGTAASVFGLSEGVLRLSVAALNLGTLGATVLLGAALGSARAGCMAAVLLATCFLFSGYAFTLRVDPALTLCTTLCLAAFAWALARPEHRRAGFLASHLALACALLTKGLPALLPTLLPILLTLAWQRDRAGLRVWGFTTWVLGAVAAVRLGAAAAVAVAVAASVFGLWPWLRGPRERSGALQDLLPGLVLVGLLGGWLAAADARYPVPYLSRAVDDSMNRVGQTMQGDTFLRPWWFYLRTFPGDFFPWTIFLPAAIRGAVRDVRRNRRDPKLVALICLVSGFVVFSAIAYKRKVYLLPLFPAAAVLVSNLFAANDEGESNGRGGALLFAGALGTAAASAAAIDLAARAFRDGGVLSVVFGRAEFAALQTNGFGVDLALMIAGLLWAAAPWLAERGSERGARAIAVGMGFVLAVPATVVALATTELVPTPDHFAESVRATVPHGAELRFAPGVRDDALLYYIARRVPATRANDLDELVASASEEGVYLIARRARAVQSSDRIRVATLVRGVGSNGPLVLLHATRARSDLP